MHESPEPRQHYLDVRRGGKVPRSTGRRTAELASERIIPRMTGDPEVISSSVGLVPTNRPSRYFWTEFSVRADPTFAAMLDIGIRTAATMHSEINLMFRARIALPAAAKTTAVGLKAARSRRRKVSQSLRSLNLI